ncbi:hypothetical protein TorRG33x02_183330, partial [Trema orientale]
NAFSVLRKDLDAEGKVDVVEDDMGNKNLWVHEVLGDNHVDAPCLRSKYTSSYRSID